MATVPVSNTVGEYDSSASLRVLREGASGVFCGEVAINKKIKIRSILQEVKCSTDHFEIRKAWLWVFQGESRIP